MAPNLEHLIVILQTYCQGVLTDLCFVFSTYKKSSSFVLVCWSAPPLSGHIVTKRVKCSLMCLSILEKKINYFDVIICILTMTLFFLFKQKTRN